MKYVAPHVFFFCEGSEIGLWNYLNNEHFVIERKYLDRILALQADPNAAESESECDTELLYHSIISPLPFEEITWKWGKASEACHFTSKNFEQALSLESESDYTKQYIDLCGELYKGVTEDDLRHRREGTPVALPPPNTELLESVTFWDAIKNRKTTRTFVEEPIPLDRLSLLLYVSFGEIHGRWNDLADRGLKVLAIHKAAPSGGGTHSCQAYVVALNVEGLSPGVYHYQPDTHSLVQISDVDYKGQIGNLLSGQQFSAKLGVGIFITSCFEKLWVKYRFTRTYRVPFIDLGHLSQLFHMVANSIGLNSWMSGVFRDDEVSRILEIDPLSTEQPLFFVGAGYGTGDYLHPELIKAIEARQAKP